MPKKNDTSECFKVTHDGVDVWCRQTPAKKGQPNIKIGTDMGLPHDMQPTFRLKQSPARDLQVVDHSRFLSIFDAVRQKQRDDMAAGQEAGSIDAAGVEAAGDEAASSDANGREPVGDEAAGVEASSGQVAGGEAAGRQYNTRGGAKPIDRFDRSEYTCGSRANTSRAASARDTRRHAT